MEAAALEQTLREHPDDLGAWLVYGDWLLEQGDVRGALIQLEHRLARTRAADRPALQREIDALVKQHQASWDAALPPGVAAATWRYGFVTKVAVTWSEGAPALIEQVLRERFVTALRVIVQRKDEADPDADPYDDDDDLPIWSPLEHSAIAALDLSRLRVLELPYLHLGAPGAAALAASASLGGIEVLDLRYCRIGDDGIAALAGSALAGSVRRLHLQCNELTGTGAHALRRFGRLVELDLRYNKLGAEGAQALLAAPFIGSLARLGLYPTDVTDEGAQELARSSRLPPALRSYWRSV